MDFLEQAYIHDLQEGDGRRGRRYNFRQVQIENLVNELDAKEFRNNFRFSKDGVRQLSAMLHDKLG